MVPRRAAASCRALPADGVEMVGVSLYSKMPVTSETPSAPNTRISHRTPARRSTIASSMSAHASIVAPARSSASATGPEPWPYALALTTATIPGASGFAALRSGESRGSRGSCGRWRPGPRRRRSIGSCSSSIATEPRRPQSFLPQRHREHRGSTAERAGPATLDADVAAKSETRCHAVSSACSVTLRLDLRPISPAGTTCSGSACARAGRRGSRCRWGRCAAWR